MTKSAIDVSRLTMAQQLELLDELWAVLGREPAHFPLTEAQRQDLDRRLDDLEREGPTGLTWDETLASIRTASR